jgi:hypothetical protein
MKTGLNKFFAAAILGISLMTAQVSQASENPAPTGVQLKFIGKVEDRPVFQLDLGNQNEYIVVVKGAYGDVLYKDALAGAIGNKKFMLNNEVVEDQTLRFEVISRKTNESVVFVVNLNATESDKMIQIK